MDLGLTEEQQMLREFARDFLEKECTEQYVRDMEEDATGYLPAVWAKMAEQGWMGLMVPEQYGGAGMGFLDLMVLIEEFGRGIVPGPFLTNSVSTIALLEAANEAQKGSLLPQIASGDKIWTLAHTELSARFDAAGVQLTATRDGDVYVLNGTKLFIRDSHVADYMVVTARTANPSPDPLPPSTGSGRGAGGEGASSPSTSSGPSRASGRAEEGVSLFYVDAKAAGISHEALETIAADKQSAVRFENVRVPADQLLGVEGEAWPVFQRIARAATVLESSYLVGLSQQAFDITLDYTKEREQFGVKIATFQALQHMAADMVTDVDASRLITYQAGWAVANDQPNADEDVHVAKAWVSEASRRVVAKAQEMHGGIGFTKDYKIQLFYRRQKVAELMWGDAEYHREAVAQGLGV